MSTTNEHPIDTEIPDEGSFHGILDDDLLPDDNDDFIDDPDFIPSSESAESTEVESSVPSDQQTNEPAPRQVGNILEAILESNRMFMAALVNRDTRRKKVYVPMPDKFDGKVGDFVDSWLEQFQTWFAHCEKVEGPVDTRTRIETAIQNTRGDISLLLTKHEADYAEFPTWESFAQFMRSSYGSKESGFDRYIRLRYMTQGDNETVDAYYAKFYKAFSRQKKWMKTPDDNFIYNYMFLDGLKDAVLQELLRLPESGTMEEASLQTILLLAKRAEQTAGMTGSASGNASQAGPIHNLRGRFKNVRKGGSSGGIGKFGKKKDSKFQVDKAALTDGEKSFLKMNITRGGGLFIRRETQMKSAWMEWARKEGLCTKCAAKGHHWRQCTVEERKKNGNKKFNAVQETSSDSAMDDYEDYLSSLSERDCDHISVTNRYKEPQAVQVEQTKGDITRMSIP